MANLRDLKKEIDYRLEEFVFDCEMAIYFHPTEPHNASLVKKYYAAMRRDMVSSFGSLFEELSSLNGK